MKVEAPLLDVSTAVALLVIFSLAWVAYGYWLGRKSQGTPDGVMLAGRNVGLALGTATAMATWVTSNTVMLAPKFAIQMGVWGLLAYSTASFGLFLFAPMAARIKTLMPKGYTSGDFIRLRYGRPTWYLFLVISLIYSLAWLVSMGMAGGIVLEALSGLPYQVGMTVILTVCVIYTLFGGLYAVIGTDFVQSIIILLLLLVVGLVAVIHTDYSLMHQTLIAQRPMLLDVLMPVALLSLFNNMFFGLGEVFHNNVWWSRAYAMSPQVAQKAFTRAGFLWLPIPILAGFIGLSAFSAGIPIGDPDMTGPLVAGTLLGKTGALFAFLVVFASLASSIDSLLASTSDLLIEDVGEGILGIRKSPEYFYLMSKGTVLGLGLVVWLLCSMRMADLIQVLFLSGPFVASLIWPVVCGLYWPQVSGRAAFWAIITGSGLGLYTYFEIGWFVASLIAAVTSLAVLLTLTKYFPTQFVWARLKEG